jgi:cell division septum initiation protein DivIVA
VELDRQQIERRDFPIVRRGYDPATVDAHLRALSAEVEELQREAEHRGQESLASVAGTQVQGILEAAQATAETIEREAAQDAQRVREAADADARRTREEAIARAREHVAAVSQATEVLLARVGSIDEETRTLVESLRGAPRAVAIA